LRYAPSSNVTKAEYLLPAPCLPDDYFL